MQRYCFALDLVDDPALIAEYDEWHTRVWPEVLASLQDAGINRMEIYRAANRLFLIVEAGETYSPVLKAAKDAANPHVQAWEEMMWKYQKALPGAEPGQKWMRMEKVFEL
ncbi:MAG: L-rhamnose mutarotase [Saprospiraceae bacterium]|nr:L-rhamnose mutarotase [Saprospiraceae bacterium]